MSYLVSGISAPQLLTALIRLMFIMIFKALKVYILKWLIYPSIKTQRSEVNVGHP